MTRRTVLTATIALFAAASLPMDSATAGPPSTPAYVVNRASDTVSVIDTQTRTVTATVPVGESPFDVAAAPDGTRAYVTNELGDTVSVIDTRIDAVIRTIAVADGPTDIAFSPTGSLVYVTNRPASVVTVIDPQTDAVTATIPVGSNPVGVAFTPDGKRAYVANQATGTVSVINTVTNTVTATIPAGRGAFDVVVSPDGTRAYVSNQLDSTVSVIDTGSDTVIATIAAGSGPTAVAITPEGGHVYVDNLNQNTVTVIDTRINTAIATVPVGPGPTGVAVSLDGTVAYVTSQGSTQVSVIDTRSNTVIATIGVGNGAVGVTFGPAADTQPPETTITGGPAEGTTTADATPTFTFSSSEAGSTTECRVDDTAFADCSSPETTEHLNDGPHTFAVRATDSAGNPDASPAIRSFTVDTTPPQTAIATGPSGVTTDITPTFTFTSSENGSSFGCRVDGSSSGTCATPRTLAALPDGPHTFAVSATDPVGNTDPTAASRSFYVCTGPLASHAAALDALTRALLGHGLADRLLRVYCIG